MTGTPETPKKNIFDQHRDAEKKKKRIKARENLTIEQRLIVMTLKARQVVFQTLESSESGKRYSMQIEGKSEPKQSRAVSRLITAALVESGKLTESNFIRFDSKMYDYLEAIMPTKETNIIESMVSTAVLDLLREIEGDPSQEASEGSHSPS